MAEPAASTAPFDTRAPMPGDASRGVGPYRLLGLAISTVLILVLALVLTASAAAAAFVGAGLALGWHEALQRFADLREAAGSSQTFLERAGVVVSMVFYVALALAVLAAARWRGGRAWRPLVGWTRWAPFDGSKTFWIVTPLTIVYGFGADVLVSKLYPPSKDWINLPTGALWMSLFVALAVLFAPVAEELLFRGWLYTALRPRIGTWAGILVSATLFALAHWEHTHIYAAAVFPVGVALGFIRERTGSLKASMACHAAYNGAASLLLVSGF